MVIADIILRKDKRDLALGNHDLTPAHRTVFIYRCHIMRTYQYIALVIHDLNDLIKLTDCCHDLIIISGF